MTFYDLSMNNKKITLCAEPTISTDVATKKYVDGKVATSEVPIGAIIMWSNYNSNPIPSSYALCDGTAGTPDLRGRFILSSGTSRIIGQNGGVETVQGSQFKIYRGSTIYIDRRSGEITGPYMLDVKIAEHVIKILDKGDSGHSFKALAVAGRHVYYIEVIEFDAASKKSFVIYNNTILWHGLCV